MNVAIFTHDLTRDNIHLMPWRTVVEVATGMLKAGHDAVILSGCPGSEYEEWTCGPVTIRHVNKLRTEKERLTLLDYIRQERFDILYWSFAWWGAGRVRKLLESLDMRIIGYIPGSCYFFRSVMRAIPSIGLRSSLPYLAQSLYSNNRLVSEMKNCGIESIITKTEFNRQVLIDSGWPENRVISVAPGKSDFVPPQNNAPVFSSIMKEIGVKPFFLFFGPPTPIRGVNQLLDAFRRVTASNGDARLVCLFRADSNVDMPLFRQRIEQSGLGERIQCVWESLTRNELAAFLNACYAVVLPFLLVPSEVPLAIIEAAEYGKPVITTGPGGTGSFAEQYGLMVPPANAKALAKAMLRLLTDNELYAQKCQAAKRVYSKHPTWQEVAQAWLKIGMEN